MASFGEDASHSHVNEPPCVDLLCRDINTTSAMWQVNSYCTPESLPLSRCAATRRLDYCKSLPPPFHIPAAISTEPIPKHDSSASDDLDSVTLRSFKVSKGEQVAMRQFHFNEEQIDCICDVLRQSRDIERLRRFLGCLTTDELHRDSGQLYKVCTQYLLIVIKINYRL